MSSLPSHLCDHDLAKKFGDYYHQKIMKIGIDAAAASVDNLDHPNLHDALFLSFRRESDLLRVFKPVCSGQASVDNLDHPNLHDALFLSFRRESDLLRVFKPVCSGLVRAIIESSPTKSCSLDPLPTWFLKKVLDVLVDPNAKIINILLSSDAFLLKMKHALVASLLNKPYLDPEEL